MKINAHLEDTIKALPCSVYWKDKNGVYLDCNEFMAKTLLGFSSPADIVGKTDYDLCWHGSANALRKIDIQVMQSGKPVTAEETGMLADGNVATYLSTKIPLKDDASNEIIGIFGISVDITSQKCNKKELQIEKVRIEAAERTRFRELVELSQNITGQALAEDATVQEHARYLFDYLENIIACMPGSVYWKDLQGIYRGGNDVAAKLVGLKTRKEMIGKTDFDFANNLKLNKEIPDSWIKVDNEVMLTGVPRLNQEEQPFKGADGKDIYQLSNKVPLYDSAGKIVGVLGISVDITERKKMEEELRQAKEMAEIDEKKISANAEAEKRAKQQFLAGLSYKLTGFDHGGQKSIEEYATDIITYLENVIACMPGSVYWKDLNGIYRGGNDIAAKLAGLLSGKEMIGKTDHYFAKKLGWSKEMLEYVTNIDNAVMHQGVPRLNYEEQPFKDADGKDVYQLSNKVPLFDKTGRVIGLVGISIDITARKKMEEALRQAKEAAEAANKAKTEFLENIRHDLRTPLTGIIGFTNLIKAEANDPKIAEYVDDVQMSSQILLELLNEALEAMRIASGETPVLKTRFNLKQTLERIIKLNISKAREKKLSLVLNYDDAIPRYLMGDPKRIQRIVLNLVANALNFTSQGAIVISVKMVEAHGDNDNTVVQLQVADTGMGIPENKKEEIFERFKRLTPSYQGTYKGLGLGLSIVKQFVDDLDGEIYVESELQKGSVFTCIFPLSQPLSDASLDDDFLIEAQEPKPLFKPVIPTSREKISDTGATRILLVEDNVLAAKVAKVILQDFDCVVDIAINGQLAFEHIKDNNYDLVFMDVGLPDHNGNEVTQKIREWEYLRDKHTPIIALTAHIEMENKQQCIEAGMDGVLSKPLVKETVIDILNAFIPRRTKHEKL